MRDDPGAPLAGGTTYRLHLPANAPAKEYWSATVYDYDSACFIREAPVISLDSHNQNRKNPDGSVDIYFAPQPPSGAMESNWLPAPDGSDGCWDASVPAEAGGDERWVKSSSESYGRPSLTIPRQKHLHQTQGQEALRFDSGGGASEFELRYA